MSQFNRIYASSPSSYFPENWENDAEMSGLMSYLKARHVNPTNYDRVVTFWKSTIFNYCLHQKKCQFTLDELKMKFKRGSQLPSPLPTVILELQNDGLIMTRAEFEKENQSWLQWGANLINPSSWLQSFVGTAANKASQSQLVYIPALKEQAKKLLIFYRNNCEKLVDCADVVGYSELMENASHIIDKECFELVIAELVRLGEVSVGPTKNGEKALKFKDLQSKGPARFTEMDANVHNLRQTLTRLDVDIKRAEQRVEMMKAEAKVTLGRGDKKGALSIMKRVAQTREEIQNKDVQYQRLIGMLQQLSSSKNNKEIIEMYKASASMFKETLERQGLTPEKVDITMDSVHETMQDYRDIEESLREGFRNLPMGDTIDDAELESELNELIREGAAKEEATRKAVPAVPALVEENGNRVRVGKRVLDLTDLPEVPSGGPSTSFAAATAASSHASNGGDTSLEERWKRLRMHAT